MNKTVSSLFVTASALYTFGNYKRRVYAQNATDIKGQCPRIEPTVSANKYKIDNLNVQKAINKATDLVEKYKLVSKIPGIVVGVSLNGRNVWIRGCGFSDIELGTKCNESTVMRLASLSKCISSVAIAKLVEEGKLQWDDSIYKYLSGVFPEKKWKRHNADITLKQLASHLGGIRDYSNYERKDSKDSKETGLMEFLNNKRYQTVYESLNIFKDDDLICEPGSRYNYTTYGYTLLSAAVQKILQSNTAFEDYLISVCREDFGMSGTYLDKHEEIILNRSRFYQLDDNDEVMHAAYIDNSYAWAGAGILSTVPDLLKFGNILLSCYNQEENSYLSKSSVNTLWTPSVQSIRGEFSYGLGFGITRNFIEKYAFCYTVPFKEMIWHGGATIGGSSYILILPEFNMTVAAICNLGHCFDIEDLVFEIAKEFATVIRL